MKTNKTIIYVGVAAGFVGIGVALFLTRKKIYKHFDYKTNLLLLTLEPKFRKKVQRFLTKASKQGMELRVISANRDCKEQNKLYAQGRTLPGKKVTNAICGKSTHNYRKAVDVVEFKNGKALWKNPNWNKIGRLGEAEGLEWGGRWKSIIDKPHFQDLGGKRISTLYAEYKRTGKLAA